MVILQMGVQHDMMYMYIIRQVFWSQWLMCVYVSCACSQTFPEIIPFIDVCVKMMEQVYNVPVDINTPTTANDRGQPSQVQN